MAFELAHQIITRARERAVQLVTVESCTGGLLAHALTDVPHASEVFWAGLVTYADSAKRAIAGVDAGLLADRGSVSIEAAEAMARGGLERLRQNVVEARNALSVSTTGVAGPGGGTSRTPVGTCFVGVAWLRSGMVQARVSRTQVRGVAQVDPNGPEERFAEGALEHVFQLIGEEFR